MEWNNHCCDKSIIMKTLLKNILIGVLLTSTLALLPTFSQNNSLTSFASIGSKCTTPGYNGGASLSGTCRDRNTYSCPGYYNSGNYCPYDPNNVQCCIPGPVYCKPPGPTGTCYNTSGYITNHCAGGTFNSGNYCPGPADVQCCIKPTPTPTPPPACGDATSPVG